VALNVLVVDDSAVVRRIILKSLRLAGVELGETFEAANGRDGLALLESHWVDLAFLDINMPLVNGEQMLQTMRANPLWHDTPVVVVSTEGSETRIRQLENLGARFIHKPFAPEAIRNVVRELTGTHHELRV
jgi:two-component system chemotaxis response regulator CheY